MRSGYEDVRECARGLRMKMQNECGAFEIGFLEKK